MIYFKSSLAALLTVLSRVLPLAILASLAFSCSSLGNKSKEEARLHLRIGVGHLESGNLPGAFSSLLEAERLDPKDPQIQNSLGLAYYTRERYDLAEKHFRNALSLKADFSDAKNNLARTLLDLNRYDESLPLLKEVMNDMTYPSPEKPILNAGIVYFKQSQFQTALDFFKKSLAMDRENCLTNNYYGRTLYSLTDFDAAAQALDRAVFVCQRVQFDEPHYFAALAHYQSGDRIRGLARLEEVIKLYPNGPYSTKAKTLLKQLRRQ